MNNHYYCDYLDNESFLEEVDKYTEKHETFDEIKEEIRRKVSSLINEAHGDSYDINDYLSQAKSLINVLTEINDRLNAD